MSLTELITKLNKAQVKIKLVNDQLEIVTPSGANRPELLDEIRKHEAALVDFFREDVTDSEPEAIPPARQQDHYELSHAQRRLWILHQLEGNESTYNIPLPYVIEGALDIRALRETFEALVRRHESLRTTFVMVNGEPRQKIHPAYPSFFKLDYHDLAGAADKEEQAKAFAVREANRVFDLETGPLIRVCLLRLAEERHLLLLTLHHIISDGWSMEVLVKEFQVLYDCLLRGEEDPLPPLRIQYKDYACWQHALLSGEGAREHQDYWLGQFSGELPVLDLPADFPRPSQMNNKGEKIVIMLDGQLVQKLRVIGLQHNASLFMTVLTLIRTLLYRYTGQKDIIIGSPIAGRRHEDLEGQVGFYVNTLAFRTLIKDSDSFSSLLGKVRRHTLDVYEHQVYPFDLLVDDLKLERDISRPPLFDVMVELEEGFMNEGENEFSSFRVGSYENDYQVAKFDLNISFASASDGLSLSMTYNKSLFRKDRMENMLAHIRQLALSVVADPGKSLGTLEYLSAYERELLTNAFNENGFKSAQGLEDLPWYKAISDGKGVPERRVYILDEHMQLLPVGISGEIYVEGPIPTPSFWLRKDFDPEKFLSNPFIPGGVLYQTGDMGRWLPGGRIEYRGRKDEVLSLRGYRIETFQIRKEMMKHEEIKDAEILIYTNAAGEKTLVAFYVADNPLENAEIKNFLDMSLPGYMIPERFAYCNEFPQTETGDTDKTLLLEELQAEAPGEPEYEPPANDIEEQLVAVWSEVLGKDRIGVNDNFFRIAGNSIKATQIVSRMYKLGYKISIRNIFTCPTIRELAGMLSVVSENKFPYEVFSSALEEKS